MDSYFKAVIKNVPIDSEELVSQFCFDSGSQGVSRALAFTQEGTTYEPSTIHEDFVTLEAYFELAPIWQSDQLKKWGADIETIVSEEPNEDWMESWKKGFEAFHLSHGVWVVPSWLEIPAEAKQVIRMDPGMAFGTGTHETTQLVAELLAGQSGESLIDVGTGTGLLAFLAQIFGFKTIRGVDVDPEAVRVSKENALANNISNIALDDTDVSKITSTYDVVLANIIDGVLSHLRDDLYRMVAPGGVLILSGILLEREKQFIQSFVLQGWSVTQRQEKGEWLGLVLKKCH